MSELQIFEINCWQLEKLLNSNRWQRLSLWMLMYLRWSKNLAKPVYRHFLFEVQWSRIPTHSLSKASLTAMMEKSCRHFSVSTMSQQLIFRNWSSPAIQVTSTHNWRKCLPSREALASVSRFLSEGKNVRSLIPL